MKAYLANFNHQEDEEALPALSHAIQIKPDLPHLHAWLAESFAELGNLQGAADGFEGACKT